MRQHTEGQRRAFGSLLVLGLLTLALATAPAVEAVAPATLPGCAQSGAVFTQSTPVAIPTGPAVVTSTIVVSGVGPYLTDVDAITYLQHTFSADLDMTLTSPAGTVVTLTTDNGAGNDNVFNGTRLGRRRQPRRPGPLHHQQRRRHRPRLREPDHGHPAWCRRRRSAPSSARIPNGTWTLTITDDLAGDGGRAQRLVASTSGPCPRLPPAPTRPPSPSPPRSQCPPAPPCVTSTIVVSGVGSYLLPTSTSITNLPHTFSADIDITLTSPAGTVVTLTTDNGAGNDNVFNGTRWDDDANPAGQVPYTTNNGVVTDHALRQPDHRHPACSRGGARRLHR